MRENRVMSISNLHQYSIVYETIMHYIVGGITSISLPNLEEEMQFLSLRSSLSGITKFQRQFEVLIIIIINVFYLFLYNSNLSMMTFDNLYIKLTCIIDSSKYLLKQFNCYNRFQTTVEVYFMRLELIEMNGALYCYESYNYCLWCTLYKVFFITQRGWISTSANIVERFTLVHQSNYF